MIPYGRFMRSCLYSIMIRQHLLFQAFYFIEKYDLADMRVSVFESFDKVMADNKTLGLVSSKKVLQNLLIYPERILARC